MNAGTTPYPIGTRVRIIMGRRNLYGVPATLCNPFNCFEDFNSSICGARLQGDRKKYGLSFDFINLAAGEFILEQDWDRLPIVFNKDNCRHVLQMCQAVLGVKGFAEALVLSLEKRDLQEMTKLLFFTIQTKGYFPEMELTP